ncbi:MAG: DNA polymerase III subunit beta [Epsilonproteobacteria bacterium]|nr:DNA polymerase III subunit beta [Campylobacterota bacterium]
MNIQIQKSILDNILNQMVNFTDKDNSQITSHILIQAQNNTITLKATDKEINIIYTINVDNIQEEGITSINGKKLHEIIKTLNDDLITIKTTDSINIISQKDSIYKLPAFDVSTYPQFPAIDDNFVKLDINPILFIEGLKKTFVTIDTNNAKYELNGALIDFDDTQTNIVSTDTKRLALFAIPNQKQHPQIIIPKKAIAEIKKLFLDNFEVFVNDIQLAVKSNNITFFTNLINGVFPDYKRIIPTQYKYTLTLNKNDFIKAIKRINVISNEVKITIMPNMMEFESISSESIEAKTDMPITTPIENFVFAINSKFVLEFLNVVDSNEIELCLNEPEIPFTLKDGNFQTIVMPLSI